MKVLAATLGAIILSIFVLNDSMAQKANYTTHDGWTMGVGGGYAYQKSDLANSRGYGFDFTLGRHLYYKENAFLSVDWKFRFLGGRNTAYDHRINSDGTYSNIRYKFFNYDLELGLTLNRLRERTGIILTGFAGAGLTHGRTFTDLYDANGAMYNYLSIDPNRDSKLVYEDLVALSDEDFETSLINRAALLPTAGIFLGYQLSRSLTLGLEFKTNFYLTEDNGFLGIDLDNKAISGSGLDRNNYVSLGVRWNFRGGSARYGSSTNNSYKGTNTYNNTTETYTQNVTASFPRPSVNITEPSSDPYQTTAPNQSIRATVDNVSGPGNISFFQNGFPVNIFAYNVNEKTFTANIRLREGENNFRIQATNQAGTAEDLATITLDNPPEAEIPAPLVWFTSPSGNEYSTSADRVELTASVKNISSKEDIHLSLNGIQTPFEYNDYSGIVKTSIRRTAEASNLLIEAINQSGSAQDQLTVHFTDPQEIDPPSVWFIDPPYPIEVSDNRFPLAAETQNVFSRNDLDLKVNGIPAGNYSFNADGTVSLNLLLSEGVNTIEITARNEAGVAADRTFITYHVPFYIEPVYVEPVYYEPQVRIYPPVIHIIRPLTYPFRTYERTEELRATVLNVHSKENIILNINGYATRDFSYNNVTKELIARISLREGENALTIHAQNESGGDVKDLLFIKETRHCPPPVVRLLDPAGDQVSTKQQTYALKADVRNISNPNQLRLLVNGKTISFSLNNQILSSTVPLARGLNSLSLKAVNECGEDNASARITYNPTVIVVPCSPPTVAFSIQEVNREDASHELRGSVSGVKNKSDISMTLDGNAFNGFQFVPSSGELSAKFKLTPGSHTIIVAANNTCGTDNQDATLIIEEPCIPPTLTFTLHEVNREDASHELRGTVTGVKNKSGISMTLNGNAYNGFQFVPSSGELSAKLNLSPGPHTIAVSANNACGSDHQGSNITVEEPCSPPKLTFTLHEVNREDASHELKGTVTGVKNKSDISMTLDGNAYNGFQFVPSTGELSARLKLSPGQHTIAVSVNNACGTDSQSANLNLDEPCSPPTLTYIINKVNREDASHELKGTVTGVKNKSGISMTLDGNAYNGFQFVPSTGELSARFKLSPGQHIIAVSVNNACGTDTKSGTVTFEPEEEEQEEEVTEECGIRINPGNSDWQFCLVSPSGTFSRESLTNPDFSYSGPASSLYFMPIGGGGVATVNGKPYAVKSGQYYLFSGNLNVSVGTGNPGSMGHWSVCVTASNEPVSGNGNNRPASPCEVDNTDKLKGASATNEPGDSTTTRSNSVSPNRTMDRTNTRTNTGTSTRTTTGTSTRTTTGTPTRTNTGTSTRTTTGTSTRTNTGTSTRTNTGSNSRTNTGSTKATNTRTIDTTDDNNIKSTDDRSVDSTSSGSPGRTRR